MPTVPSYQKRILQEFPTVQEVAYTSDVKPENRRQHRVEQWRFWWNKLVGDGDELSPKKAAQATEPATAQPEAAQSLSVREALWTGSREPTGKEAVKHLDEIAYRQLEPNQTETPALRDYAILRQAAQDQQIEQSRAQAQAQAAQEAMLICNVGAQSRNAVVLENYLTAQLPVYEAGLKQQGMDETQARQNSQYVRRQTVQAHLNRSLGSGDWKTAVDVLHACGQTLLPQQYQDYCEKTTEAYVRAQAQYIWQQARQEQGADLSGAKQWAETHLPQDAGAELHPQIRQHITQYYLQAQAQHCREASQFSAELATLSTDEMQRRLDSQDILSAQQTASSRAAIMQARPAAVTDPAWFCTQYFEGTGKAARNAVAKGQCGASDYFRLESARLSREGGNNLQEDQYLMSAVSAHLHKKGFSETDISAAQYAVLTGGANTAERAGTWQQLKQLID